MAKKKSKKQVKKPVEKPKKGSFFDLSNTVEPEEKSNEARGNPRTMLDKIEVDEEMKEFDRIFE